MQEIDFSRCRAAATRAYHQLRRKGVRDPRAFTAAIRVFGYHCPAFDGIAARHLVADWLDQDLESLN